LKAAVTALEGDDTPAAQHLREEYGEALAVASRGQDPHHILDNALRWRVLSATRHSLDDLRRTGAIGDDAFRRVEEELDWLELSARPGRSAD
jgi:CPA1 family monovalent cation:H+ antiporter